MNKLFTKIAALALGATMAVGVGVAVASNSKVANQARATDYTKIATFDFSETTPSGSTSTALTSSTLLTLLNDSSSVADLVSSATKNSGDVYTGKGTGGGSIPQKTLKVGKASGGGSISFTIGGNDDVSKVVVNGHVWKNTSSISVNSGTAQTYSTVQSATAHPFEFELASATKTITIAVTTSCVCISSIDIYKTAGGGTTKHDLTYAVGTQGVYDGSTTKTFSVAESGTHTVKTPAAVGISANAGYVFSTWNDGTSNYAPNSAYTMGTSDVTLTAQWVAGIALSYNKNNNSATGSTDTTYVVSGGTQTVSACGFSLDGYTFSHWNTAADDSGVSYDPDDQITSFTSALELFAIWEETHYVTISYSGSTTNMTGGNDAALVGVSAKDWSVVGYKNKASNMPGLNSAGQIRLYGNPSGGNYVCVNTLKANRSITKIELSTGNSGDFKVYEGDQTTSGTAVTGSSGTYTFSDDVTGFTIINTNSGTTQVYIYSIIVHYEDEAILTPTLVLSNTPSSIGVGSGTASFTVEYFNLTSEFTVTTDTTYVTASYTGATGTGSTTVTLSGVATINSTTITVSSTGAESQSFTAAVEVLPLIDTNLSSMTWGNTSYGLSPHVLTWNSSYTWSVSAGQHNGGTGYLGANSTNAKYTTVGGEYWTMTGPNFNSLNSAMSTADSGSSYWSTYGSAFRMLNFGVVHPTSFSVTAGTVGNTSDKYYLFASTDSGDSWTYLTGNNTITADTAMTWSNSSTYASESNPVQFAFVFTGSTSGKTISNITVKVWADSYATTKVLDSIYVLGTPKTAYKVGESFDLNGAVVKARYTDSTTYPDEDVSSSVSWSAIAHGTTQVTGSYGGKDVTVGVTVTDEGTVYKKVLSTDELIVGAKVIIGTSNGGYTAGAQGSTNKNRNSEAAGGSYGYYEDGDIENWSVNTTVFTVGLTETGYTFHDGNGYLYAASSSDNVLRVENELDANHNGEWSISIANGVATIVSQGTNTHNTMNGNATAFSVYASPTVAISLYSDVAQTMLYGFGETYLHMTDYTSQSGYCKDDEHHYYLTAKAALIAMGSEYITELQQNDNLDSLQARYEDWARACGDTSPYAGTGIVKSNVLNVISNTLGGTNAVIIVVVTSVISLTAIGGYFFLRKRREQN